MPTNSVLLLDDAETARNVPRGSIELGHCASCGFVHNVAFDPALTEYSGRYESTQSFSETFNTFNADLAHEMVERFELRGKVIIEIGCGHGEFLAQLCEIGGNSGVGFDPAHLPGRVEIPPATEIQFVQDFYGTRYADRQADFVACKMTLEHILEARTFIRTVRSSIGDRLDTTVCFQVPNGRYVFGQLAFWDIYYEHCSYFTSESLGALFEREGFDVIETWTGYDDQYLMLAARPRSDAATAEADKPQLASSVEEIDRFRTLVPVRVETWQQELRVAAAQGLVTVLWGGGSKGVAFLTTLGISDEVAAVVDINPRKAGTYMAGTGHPIVGPAALRELDPDVVIVMNPVYLDEISRQLHSLGLTSRVRPVS